MKLRVLIMIFLATTIVSCDISNDDNTAIINYQVIPVTNVEFPQSFNFGETHVIPVMFELTNDCQNFAGFELESNLNERIITVVASVINGDCQELTRPSSQDLRFVAASNGTYVFKFFTGLNSNNEPMYLEYTIPVEE